MINYGGRAEYAGGNFMIDKRTVFDRLFDLSVELKETILLYEETGYRTDELIKALVFLLKTMDDVAKEA